MTFMIKGGLMMWPILFFGLLGLAIFFERVFHFHRAQINVTDFVNGVRNSLKRGNLQESIANCDDAPGPVAQVVKVAVVNHDRPRTEIREAVQEVAHTEIARLERNLPILATIAQVAPLLGFLGTVMGLIKSFQIIQDKQFANPGDIAGGIWMALITTAAGLAVAIPTYVAYNYLVSRVRSMVLDMEQAANDIVGFLTGRADRKPAEEPMVPVK